MHARSVVAAVIDTQTGTTTTARLVPSPEVVLEWVHALRGPVAVTYEAGPTGYGLARAFTAASVRCVVAAPSKIVRPAGDRVKTDAKDALLLARLLRMDEITAVRVPTVGEEAARDLVRAREDARIDLMAARVRGRARGGRRFSPLRSTPAASPPDHFVAASKEGFEFTVDCGDFDPHVAGTISDRFTLIFDSEGNVPR